MMKILRYNTADLCADLDGVAAAVTHACRQASGPYLVRGLVQLGDHVLLQLLRRPAGPPETYLFVELCDPDDKEVVGLLNERWAAGFDCVGSVSPGDGLLLVLLARPETPA